MTADELAPVVSRDGVGYSGSALPEEMLARLASNEVVVLGETHHLREHWEFVAALMGELHKRGFRQLLVERPHMND